MECGSGPTAKELADLLRPVWEVHLRLCLERRVNLRDVLKQWALRTEKSLDDWVASQHFKALKDAGCCPELLTILMAAIKLAPALTMPGEMLSAPPVAGVR